MKRSPDRYNLQNNTKKGQSSTQKNRSLLVHIFE